MSSAFTLWRHAVTLLAATTLLATGCGDSDGDADTATTDTATTDTAVGDSTETDTAADTTADTTPPPTCGTDSPTSLGACVESSRIEADIRALAVIRTPGSAGHTQTRTTLETRLADMGYTVELHAFAGSVNVIGVKTGKTTPDDVVVISAHYDGVENCTAADDNASGVAGALEAARVLAMTEHDRTVIVAFWDEEERGKLGSAYWADRAALSSTRIVMSYVFEMIGFKSDAPDSQMFPPGFGLLFPGVETQVAEDGNKGDFIALIVGDDGTAYSDAMVSAGQGIGLQVIPVVLDASFRKSSALGDLLRSDHHPFWHRGWPAMMITDTANFRNTNYHCTAGPDAPDDLDFDFAADVVSLTVSSAAIALADSAPTAGDPPDALACDLSTGGCAAGEHCTLTSNSVGWVLPECVTLQDTTVGPGASCMRPSNATGVDNCEAGQFCTFWGLPSGNPQLRHCLALCDAAEDCGEGEQCQSINQSYLSAGLCTSVCDPFDTSTCPADTNCHGERLRIDGTPSWLCGRVGTAAAGELCRPVFDECAAGLGCGFDPADGLGRCGANCDDAHACDGGKTCVPRVNNPAGDTRGICL